MTRNFSQLLNGVPSLAGGSLDSQVQAIGQGSQFFNSYGSRPNEGRVYIDGLSVGGGYNGGGIGFAPDPSTAEEMQVTVAGGLGESESGSASVNFVPKTGGNSYKGPGILQHVSGNGLRPPTSTINCGATASRRLVSSSNGISAARWAAPSCTTACGSSRTRGRAGSTRPFQMYSRTRTWATQRGGTTSKTRV